MERFAALKGARIVAPVQMPDENRGLFHKVGPEIVAALRDQINNPLYFHCLLDSHHLETLRGLGVLTTPNVKLRLAAAYPHHVAYGLQPAEPGFDEDIAFTGNLFSPRPPRGEG